MGDFERLKVLHKSGDVSASLLLMKEYERRGDLAGVSRVALGLVGNQNAPPIFVFSGTDYKSPQTAAMTFASNAYPYEGEHGRHHTTLIIGEMRIPASFSKSSERLLTLDCIAAIRDRLPKELRGSGIHNNSELALASFLAAVREAAEIEHRIQRGGVSVRLPEIPNTQGYLSDKDKWWLLSCRVPCGHYHVEKRILAYTLNLVNSRKALPLLGQVVHAQRIQGGEVDIRNIRSEIEEVNAHIGKVYVQYLLRGGLC